MLKAHSRKRKLRDPQRTRERLLQAAFREVYHSGFQGAGLDTILASTGVTKGALYHHFGSKEALGYAIVEEIVAPIGIASGFDCEAVLINSQRFTKTANIWGISNNRLGTNTNRIAVFRKAGA